MPPIIAALLAMMSWSEACVVLGIVPFVIAGVAILRSGNHLRPRLRP